VRLPLAGREQVHDLESPGDERVGDELAMAL
jgi:hypothetical protein